LSWSEGRTRNEVFEGGGDDHRNPRREPPAHLYDDAQGRLPKQRGAKREAIAPPERGGGVARTQSPAAAAAVVVGGVP